MIKIITPCDSFKHFEQPINEFLKRLWKEVIFQKIKPSKRWESHEIIKEETEKLSKVLQKEKGYKVLLYIDSKQLTTENFAKLIENSQMKHSGIVFIIGGAYGVDYEKLRDQIDTKLSFSPMTFPHSQALMMLLEQVYRASCMKKGVKYHH